jgi:hypothetical protein
MKGRWRKCPCALAWARARANFCVVGPTPIIRVQVTQRYRSDINASLLAILTTLVSMPLGKNCLAALHKWGTRD